MWNLAFESYLELFQGSLIHVNGFADDAALLLVGDNPNIMVNRMQLAINKTLEWGDQHGLAFSAPKTKVILFHRKRELQHPRKLCMGNILLDFESDTRYLGILLDEKLSFRAHLKHKIATTKHKLLKVRNSLGKLWGTQPHMLRWIYTCVIRPALTYGSLIWAKVVKTTWAQRDLQKLNRLFLMSFGAFRRSTPTAGLEVMFHVQPLPQQILNDACLGLARTTPVERLAAVRQTDKSISGHRNLCWQLLDKHKLVLPSLDRIPLEFIWDRKYRLDKISLCEGKPPHRKKTAFDYTLYTDGSGLHNSFGAGLIVFRRETWASHIIHEESFSLGETSSVFQGEVYAIKQAAMWIRTNCFYRNIAIYSDSKAALMALDRAATISKLEKETKQALMLACEFNQITLKWIKAHQGYLGNEKADDLAKAGSLQPNLVPDLPAVPVATLKLQFKAIFVEEWQDYWSKLPTCRQTKQWFPAIDKKKSFDALTLGRSRLSVLVQIITGHNFLKRHEALVNENDDAECRLCLEDDETTFHVLAECPALAEPRMQVFGSTIQAAPLQWTIQELVSFVCRASINHLFDPTGALGSGL